MKYLVHYRKSLRLEDRAALVAGVAWHIFGERYGLVPPPPPSSSNAADDGTYQWVEINVQRGGVNDAAVDGDRLRKRAADFSLARAVDRFRALLTA